MSRGETEHETGRQEAESLDGRALRRIGVGFLLATLFGVLLALVMIAGTHGARGALGRALGAHAHTVPGADETAQYRRIARRKADPGARLRGYGWVDRDAGIVHVPIERAFELLSAEAARSAAVPEPSEGRSAATATSALPARSRP
jgi:hypothetical protein